MIACGGVQEIAGSASEGLVFARQDGRRTNLFRLRLGDGAERPLVRSPRRDETWPYWSDLAQQLVFQTTRRRQGSDLTLWSAAEGAHGVNETPHREERWPAWSPTRPEIVFAFRGGTPAAGLALLAADTREVRLLAAASAEATYLRPSWSPDGEALVAQRHPPASGSELWLVSRDGSARALTKDPRWFDLKPFFERDGRRVVFSRRAAGGGPHDVMRIDTRGGPSVPFLADPRLDEHSARPSPTRDEIAFVSDRDGGPQIYLAPLDGVGARQLPLSGDAFAPRWSPDGELLAVTLAPFGAGMPKLADPDALSRTRIVVIDRNGAVRAEAAGFMPDWMPPWR